MSPLKKSAGMADSKGGQKDIPVIDEMPYVNFEIPSGRFYGSNGCNILNGSFNVDNTTISFNGVISTLKMCQDVEYQYDINAVIGDGKSYQVEATVEGGVNYIYLNDARGHHAITLRRSDMSFLNGQWKITRLGDKDIDNEEMNIFIDMPEATRRTEIPDATTLTATCTHRPTKRSHSASARWVSPAWLALTTIWRLLCSLPLSRQQMHVPDATVQPYSTTATGIRSSCWNACNLLPKPITGLYPSRRNTGLTFNA